MSETLSRAALGKAAEAAVVALAMSGDRNAFSELVWRKQVWLRGLLRRLAINAWLAHRRKSAVTALDALPQELPASVMLVPAVGERFDLDRALAHLAPDERLCVVLAYSEGMSHGEISATTALPLGTVKSHIRRGTQRLRGLLHAYRPSEEQTHVG